MPIDFTPHHECVRDADYTQVEVPAKALAKAAGLYNNPQLPPPRTGLSSALNLLPADHHHNEHIERYERVARQAAAGKMESPWIGCNGHGGVGVPDGKHRIFWLAEKNRPITVSVRKDEVENLRAELAKHSEKPAPGHGGGRRRNQR